MTQTQRAFLAFEVPEQLRSALADYCDAIRHSGMLEKLSPRWVRPESRHVTLRFLGDATGDSLDALSDFLDEQLDQAGPFATECVGIVGFPNASRALVLAAGLSASEDLQELARLVDARAVALGSPGEARAYVPHVTLARLKRRGAIPMHAQEAFSTPGKMHLSRVVLFESVLAPKGAQYRALRSWDLTD